MHSNSERLFKKLSNILIVDFSQNLKNEFRYKGFFGKVLLFPFLVFYVPLMILIGLFLRLFVVLDEIAHFTQILKNKSILSLKYLAVNSTNNLFNLIVYPPLLLALLPIFVFLILIGSISLEVETWFNFCFFYLLFFSLLNFHKSKYSSIK